MTAQQIMDSMSCCGLICGLCQPSEVCNCRMNNHCGKRLTPDGCYQYDCCIKKKYEGCWQCPDAPCGKDMHSADNVKIRAFIRCLKEDGLERFAQYIFTNAEKGIVYHREGIHGDYDLESEEDVVALLRSGTLE